MNNIYNVWQVYPTNKYKYDNKVLLLCFGLCTSLSGSERPPQRRTVDVSSPASWCRSACLFGSCLASGNRHSCEPTSVFYVNVLLTAVEFVLPWKLSEYDCEPAENSTTSLSLIRYLRSSSRLSMLADPFPPDYDEDKDDKCWPQYISPPAAFF